MRLDIDADYTPRPDVDDRMFDSVPVFAAVRRGLSRTDQDWEDRLQDSMVFLLEHSGVMTDEDGNETPVESPAGLAIAHCRGRLRNVRVHRQQFPAISLDCRRPNAHADSDDTPTVGERLMARDTADSRAIIRQHLRRLTVRQRATVALLFRGLTQAQIAEKLHVSQPTIARLAKGAASYFSR